MLLFSLLSCVQMILCDPMDCNTPGSVSPLSPGICSNSCPLSWWCYLTISSFVVPFSSCLQSFPASGSLPVSQFFASGSQSIGASASATVLPVNVQGWLPLESTGLFFFQCITVIKKQALKMRQRINWDYNSFCTDCKFWWSELCFSGELRTPCNPQGSSLPFVIT